MELTLEELLTYLVCPLRFVLDRSQPQKPADELEIRVEATMQSLVAWIYTQGITTRYIPSPLDIQRRWEELWWEGRPKPKPEEVLFGQVELELPGSAVATMLHHLNQHLERLPFAPIASRMPFTLRLADVAIHGILPAVREIRERIPGQPPHRRLEIVVYRLRSPEYTPASGRIGLDGDLELSAYAMGFLQLFDRLPNQIRVVDLRTGKEVTTRRDRTSLLRFEGVVTMLASALKANVHHPRPGAHCLRCPYTDPCLGWRLQADVPGDR